MAYERVAGLLGQQRDDLHTAQLAERITNALSAGKGRQPKPADFLIDWTAKGGGGDGDD